FAAAGRCRTPAEVFVMFSPYLTAPVNEKKKNRDPAYAKREAIEALLKLGPGTWVEVGKADGVTVPDLDPRWLDLAVKLGRIELVQSLAVPNHTGANAFLAKSFKEGLSKSGDDLELLGILETWLRSGHAEAVGLTSKELKR